MVGVHGSVLTVNCVCPSSDVDVNRSSSTCDAARQRLPHTLSPCAGKAQIPPEKFPCGVKIAFHDTDIDADILARMLVRIFADTSDFLARMSVWVSWNAALR